MLHTPAWRSSSHGSRCRYQTKFPTCYCESVTVQFTGSSCWGEDLSPPGWTHASRHHHLLTRNTFSRVESGKNGNLLTVFPRREINNKRVAQRYEEKAELKSLCGNRRANKTSTQHHRSPKYIILAANLPLSHVVPGSEKASLIRSRLEENIWLRGREKRGHSKINLIHTVCSNVLFYGIAVKVPLLKPLNWKI
jgi:hypothetical protein